MKKQTSIEDKFQTLQNALSEQQTFIMADVEDIFPDLVFKENQKRYFCI